MKKRKKGRKKKRSREGWNRTGSWKGILKIKAVREGGLSYGSTDRLRLSLRCSLELKGKKRGVKEKIYFRGSLNCVAGF